MRVSSRCSAGPVDRITMACRRDAEKPHSSLDSDHPGGPAVGEQMSTLARS